MPYFIDYDRLTLLLGPVSNTSMNIPNPQVKNRTRDFQNKKQDKQITLLKCNDNRLEETKLGNCCAAHCLM